MASPPRHPARTIPYLLSVYVEPAWRRRGLARAIAVAAVQRSQEEGHPRIALHASEAGRPVYAALGFQPGPEMWLPLPALPAQRL